MKQDVNDTFQVFALNTDMTDEKAIASLFRFLRTDDVTVLRSTKKRGDFVQVENIDVPRYMKSRDKTSHNDNNHNKI